MSKPMPTQFGDLDYKDKRELYDADIYGDTIEVWDNGEWKELTDPCFAQECAYRIKSTGE